MKCCNFLKCRLAPPLMIRVLGCWVETQNRGPPFPAQVHNLEIRDYRTRIELEAFWKTAQGSDERERWESIIDHPPGASLDRDATRQHPSLHTGEKGNVDSDWGNGTASNMHKRDTCSRDPQDPQLGDPASPSHQPLSSRHQLLLDAAFLGLWGQPGVRLVPEGFIPTPVCCLRV